MEMNEKMLRFNGLPFKLRMVVPTLTKHKVEDEDKKIKAFHLITTNLTNSEFPTFGFISARYNPASN